MAQSLPDGWWQQDSAENILAKAQSITRNLSYFQGSKAHLLDNQDASIDFFQLKMPDGVIETKYVQHQGRMTLTDYNLEKGRYIYTAGRLIKTKFENDKEQSLAARFDNPYDYKILKPEIVGTNNCLVVARIATPQFFEAMMTNYYPRYTPGQDGPLGDLVQYIWSETDTYIRKNDGVIIGEVKKNKFGKILDDKLYEVVQVNNPIPIIEFVLPKATVESATNNVQLLHIVSKGMLPENPISPKETMAIRIMIIGIMVSSLGILLYIIFSNISSQNSRSTQNLSDDKTKE
jgi:hypothetical protein